MNKFTLAIEDVVEVPVKFTLKSGKVNKPFSLILTARRVSKDEIETLTDQSIREFFVENITDWSGNRLILDADGNPAPFSKDAFEALLDVAGVWAICWAAYQLEIGGKAKN